MLSQDAIRTIEALLAGCDPSTGEVLGPLAGSVLRRDEVRQALALAVEALAEPEPQPKPVREPLWPVPDGHPLAGRQFDGDRPIEIARELKADYRSHMVFVQNGYFWETYEDDAYACSEVFGWRVTGQDTGHVFTGVPANAFRFKETLTARAIPYIMVAQVACPSPGPVVQRHVVELFDAQTR